MTQDLKPCPFCGSDKVFLHTPHFRYNLVEVGCANCGASGKAVDRPDEYLAIDAWNRRVENALENKTRDVQKNSRKIT
jgi:Lar family restriction alleviation protein